MSAWPEVQGMTQRIVDVDGVGIHIAEAGSGPPVLLLHGWPQNWLVWRKVAPALAADHHVICADLRGFGWSDAPAGPYAKATLAGDMIGVLDALGLDRVDLIGHDWGAWIGFILCLDHPERFDHYLALSTYPPWPEPPSPRTLLTLGRLWFQAAIATPVLGAALIRHTPFVRTVIKAGTADPQTWTREELDAFTVPLTEAGRAAASVRLYRTFLLRELPRFARGQYVGRRLTVPTLLLNGTRDPAIDHRRLGDWRSHADDMDVELRDEAGHFIADELPDVVVDRARQLFGRM